MQKGIRNPAPVKPACVLLFHPALVARLQNRNFGSGLSAEHSPRFADELIDAVGLPIPRARWASDAEYEAHRLAETLSVEEYAALQAERRAAEIDRYARADEAELSEWGITADRMDDLARESAELDAVCRGLCFA